MLITEVTTEEGFDSLRPEWNALVSRLELPSPFQTWEWSRVWWRHFGAGHRLRLLVFRDAGELTGVAQLHERRLGPGRLGPALLAPIGWEDRQRRQGITEQSELIFPAPRRAELLVQLSAWLEEHRWSILLLPGLEPSQELPAALAKRVVLMGKPNNFPHRPLPTTWPEFVAGLGKSMRDNVKYYPRLLSRTGHEFCLRVHDTPATVPAALKVFLDLHRARAEAATTVVHKDKFAARDRRDFLREVAPLLAGRGQLKVGLLEVGGAAVAAQIWMEMGHTMFLYYTGYDPAWSSFSVQLVATLEGLKRGMERGITHVEFLRGAGQRNQRWNTSNRVRVNVTAARHPALVRLMLRAPRLRRDLRLHGTTASVDIFNWTPAG